MIRFDSTDNPAFPREEWERARATLPPWKFKMFYQGYFEPRRLDLRVLER